MQIVRDLAGYTMGRSDLVRRAMSKKKTSVMEKERQNFVYGNPEEGVMGCIANGIDEKTANHIYDEMIDFAKYAFNKSHAAAYAVVSYQTAFLKYYYPQEYMAALLTSVMDNVTKVSEYILSCRQMGISILPPDINEGESGFSVSGGAIRYGSRRSERWQVRRGLDRFGAGEQRAFTSIEDFVDRMSNKEVNKQDWRNFIKSGALDTLPGTRKQKILVAPELLDQRKQGEEELHGGAADDCSILPARREDAVPDHLPQRGRISGRRSFLAFEKEALGST